MPEALFRFWYPRYKVKRSSTIPQLRFIVGLCLVGAATQAVYLVQNLLHGLPIFPTNMPLFGFVGLLVVARIAPSYALIAHAFMAMTALMLTGLVALYQTFPYTILMWVPIYGIVAVYLVGRRAGAVWTALTSLFTIAVISSPSGTFGPGQPIDPSQVTAIAVVSILLTALSAVSASWLFATYISKLTRDLDEKNRKLEAKSARLEEEMSAKQALIKIVCHDIATPLTVIKFAAEAGLEQVGEDRFLEKIDRSAGYIRSIVDEVGQLQAVESGKLEVDVRPTNLDDVFAQLRFLFADRLEAKDLTLSFHREDNCSPWVMAEETSLTHNVLSNFISNAIKFSEPKDQIAIAAESRDGHIFLSVRDSGIGMPASIAAGLFKQDARTSRRGTQGERGTGFGMPIAKIFMEKYGGDVFVESVEKTLDVREHGTTFTLTFEEAPAPKDRARPSV